MQGSILKFYVQEGHRHGSRLVWEWLLEEAKKLGVPGGTAYRAMGGFGRDRILNEANFVELAGSLAVEIEFVLSDVEAQQLIDLIHRERVRLFFARVPAQFGVVDPESAGSPRLLSDS